MKKQVEKVVRIQPIEQWMQLYKNESVTSVKILAQNFAEISGLEYLEQLERRKPEIIR